MTAERADPLEVAGGRFAMLADGPEDGPLVVCLHGFPDHAESYAPFMARLAEAGYRAVAPWMRGYAPSILEGPYHADQLADDALAIARALVGGRRFALIGHDWGAFATWAACARAPSDLACAVAMAAPHPLASAAMLRRPSQLIRSWYVMFFQLPRLPEWALARDDFALVDRLWRTWSPGYALPEESRRRLHQCLRASMPAPLTYYRAIPRQMRLLRQRSGERITTPVLYLHGAEDGCIMPAAAAGQERYMRGPFANELVDNAGHFLQLERPDEVADRALRWLRVHHPCPS